MELQCRNCGNEWESRKDSLSDYSDGPRCSDCGSREAERCGDNALQSDYEVAFRLFSQGKSPAEVVAEGVAPPDRVRELHERFNELSEHRLLSPDEVEAIRENAFRRGEEHGRSEAWDSITATLNHRRQAYNKGYDQGYADGYRQAQDDLSHGSPALR